MEKILLTEEQTEKFIKEWSNGDIYGIDILEKILRKEQQIKDNDLKLTIYDIIAYTRYVNTLKVATEMWSGLEDVTKEIETLYDKMKNKLFNSFENDFTKYFEKFC